MHYKKYFQWVLYPKPPSKNTKPDKHWISDQSKLTFIPRTVWSNFYYEEISLFEAFLIDQHYYSRVVGLMSHPAWARGTPFPPLLLPCPFTSSSFALYYFSLFPFLIHFTYFLLLSIRSLSTRKKLRFQAWGRRRRPNLGLVCFVLWLCYLYWLVKIYSGILLYLV